MASGGAEQPLDSAAESVARLWQPVAEGPNHRVTIRIDRGRALITVWRLAPGLLLSLLVSSPSHHHSVIPTVALLAVFLGVSISSAIRRRTLITFDDSGFQAGKGSYCEWPELTAIRILERRTPSGGLRGVQQLHLLGSPVSDGPLQHRILGVVDPNLMSIPADVVIDMLLKHRKVPVERQAASLFTLRIGGTTRRYARAERLLLGFLTAASLLIMFSGVVTVASGRVVTGLCTLAAGSGIATYCFRASQKSDKVVRPVVIGGNTTVSRGIEKIVFVVLGLLGATLGVLGVAVAATGDPGPGLGVILLGGGITSFCTAAVRRRATKAVEVPRSSLGIRV